MKEQAKHAAEIFSAIAEGKKIEMNIAAESQPEEWKEVDPAAIMVNMYLVKHCRVAELDYGWIEWKGGKCPVSAFDNVIVKLKNKKEIQNVSYCFRWTNLGGMGDIIAYKIV